MSDLKTTLDRLYALIPRGRRLGLEHMQAACAKFGNPERSFPAVHVAGTNGKGTVCAFVASMGRAAGVRVGLYTSPHLCRFAERIQIDGVPIQDEVLVRLLSEVMDQAPDLTFFEVATLAAFLAFREAGVQLAVLEVGLGGRLDATNVIPPPRVAAISRIAFDHKEELGDTLAKIAGEKAGIIKPGSAVVLGKIHPEARAVIEAKVQEVGARLLPLGSPEPIPGAPLAYPRVALLGSNLAVAVSVGRELGFSQEVLAQGVEQTSWPGRNELLHRNGQELTLLDCAHNPDGAVALSHSLDPSVLGEIESRREIALVFGAINTKNWRAMLKRLEQVAGHRIYVAPPIRKAVDPQEMMQASPGEVAPNVPEALARARALVGPRGVVVVTGSIFLVGAARAFLLNLPADPAVDLYNLGMPSFDVVSKVDWSEVTNALNQAQKELSQRFDFKGTEASVEKNEQGIVVGASSDDRAKAALEVLQEKLIRRKVSLKYLDVQKPTKGPKGSARILVKVKEGLETEKAKEIVKLLKDSKLKVQAAIQEQAVRVSGKKKDDLQQAIALLRRAEQLNLELQFVNFRD